MKVKLLSGPGEDEGNADPSWNDIEAAIQRLDGEQFTLVILEIDCPTPHMAIGGGNDGRFIVYATEDNNSFYNLVKPGDDHRAYEVKAGGQIGQYRARQCVTRSEALKAAKVFAESGLRDPDLSWDVQAPK